MKNKVKCAIRTGSVLIKMGEKRERERGKKKKLYGFTHTHKKLSDGDIS